MLQKNLTILIAHMSKVILCQLPPARTLSIFISSNAYLDIYWMSQTFVLNFWLPTCKACAWAFCFSFTIVSSPLFILSMWCCQYHLWLLQMPHFNQSYQCMETWKRQRFEKLHTSKIFATMKSSPSRRKDWRKASQNDHILHRTVRFFLVKWSGVRHHPFY